MSVKISVKKALVIACVVPSLMMMTGCARNIGASNYTAGSVGEAMTSYAGTIVSKRQVVVQDQDKLQNNTLGLVAGGVGGGLLGSTVGKGRGSTLAAVGGAAAGALAGAFAQQELSKQNALEYTIKLDSGQIKTVVQGLDVNVEPGSRVILHIGQKGRSRIVPFNG